LYNYETGIKGIYKQQKRAKLLKEQTKKES